MLYETHICKKKLSENTVLFEKFLDLYIYIYSMHLSHTCFNSLSLSEMCAHFFTNMYHKNFSDHCDVFYGLNKQVSRLKYILAC